MGRMSASARADRAAHEPSQVALSRPSGEHPLRVLDLFSGIGGFSLGLDRAGGFVTAAFCEINPFCRRVLAKHWPGVPCYDDVRTLTAATLAADGVKPNCIVGGFPCQDLSRANGVWSSRPGLEGARSGLWSEYARLIREILPDLVVVENVPDLRVAGLATVLSDLAACGYDAEWDCLPATFAGGRHPRERLWLVSYPSSKRLDGEHGQGKPQGHARRVIDALTWSEPHSSATTDWVSEPAVPRVVDGVSAGMDRAERVARTKALGNAVVPQIPELIGRAILAAIADTHPEGGDGTEIAAPFMSSGGAKQSPNPSIQSTTP
jgi:DNA (cytosine-5)-methyltransferase 1